MASDLSFIEYVTDNMKNCGAIRFRKMFGEYGVYCNDKIVALVCDNQLFVKQTIAGREFIEDITLAPAYPNAKDSFLITDEIDDSEWLSELIKITEKELPKPKAKKSIKKT